VFVGEGGVLIPLRNKTKGNSGGGKKVGGRGKRRTKRISLTAERRACAQLGEREEAQERFETGPSGLNQADK